MDLDWWQNFVSAQYFYDKRTEFDQILYMHRYWKELGDFCKMAAGLWLFIDVDLDFYVHLSFLQHEKRCSGTLVRSSENLSYAIIYVCGQ